ncbi:TetR/AcrR family transcriptional regulator C-terminal ligand-binding domain-containing protein [Catenulispora sp. NF23]|uniref:TetR-like C-terminal domain-containing protein n=1 Tax=Catenulispora pinistramenti TaxID=2705254 RepID=UPI001BA7E40D|nr:TetR-like C-terminal domain-containing protein [Catenulispora pinistramenti]MBS2531649.1 TetR/AcrR family transcriptional regulator C-terminal ligand-binding domain-containing protein [Catenulispora pinistramenti]
MFPDIDVSDLPIPQGPDFAADVRIMIHQAVEYLSRPEVLAATPALMSEFKSDPDLHRLMATRLEARLRNRLAQRVEAAIASGEAEPCVDADLLLDVITGTVLFALLSRPHMPRPVDVNALTAMLLHGVLPRHARPK